MGGFIPMATARFGNFAFYAGFGGLFPSIFNIQVTVPKGSLSHLSVKVNVGFPPDAVYNIVTDPDNKRVFKNIQVVDLEQAALWKFLWWSGTIPVHVLGDQNREDHSMKFKQVKTDYMKRFEGCWKVEPVLVLIVLKSKLYLRNYLTNAMLMNQFESRKDKRFSVDTGGTNSRESGNRCPAYVLRNERAKDEDSLGLMHLPIIWNNDSIEKGKIPSDLNDFLDDANIDNMLSVEKGLRELNSLKVFVIFSVFNVLIPCLALALAQQRPRDPQKSCLKAEVELPEEGKNLTETVKSEDDYIDLEKAGLGSCLLGGLPDWLISYSA
ncbi:hypothetical protein POM88_006795 [Heracleum sosnowskyi]|uniref:Uncharacterized protein n=1 Tax=Heracleum sosnowskyi TaxID=360622 RepID=A0AAD8N5M7_9APIA|nr:hypothetical protein POM88_006795 [Heracleum sosnowskyi]